MKIKDNAIVLYNLTRDEIAEARKRNFSIEYSNVVSYIPSTNTAVFNCKLLSNI